ncbi:acyltransferase family protein [Streptomyces phytohabitans]
MPPTMQGPHAYGPLPPENGRGQQEPGERRPGRPEPGDVRERGPGGAREPGRDPFFDNAKYLAVVLVACAHSWEPYLSDSRVATALYLFVYAFHMPAFIVVSGHFSRGFDLGPRRARRLLAGVLAPYVVFECAYALFRRWAHDDPTYPVSLTDPYFLDWFLVALFVWRLTTPVWRTLRWPLPVALALAVLAEVTPDVGPDLDLQRVLQFLPFFVLGLVLEPRHFARVRRPVVRRAAVPVAAAALACAYWAAPRMNHAWLYHRDSGQELGVPAAYGAAMALGLFCCSLVLTVCFLAWVPGRRTWFTVLGGGTLYGFLLHGFLVKGSLWWGWYDMGWPRTPFGMVVVTLVAGAVVTALCTAPVRRAFRCVVEPRVDWLFRPDPVAQARRRVRADDAEVPTGGREPAGRGAGRAG